jgi:integrase
MDHGMRGLRRGEACGLKWEDLDLEEGLACIVRQVQERPDGRPRACPLKTESSRRAVALDADRDRAARPPQLAASVA